MEETAQPPRVRARERSESLTGNERAAPPKGPRRKSKRVGGIVLATSVFISGCAGIIVGNEYGKSSKEPEVSELQATLRAAKRSNAKVSDTWRQATIAGFDHAAAITANSSGDVKLTLSTDPKDLNDPHACKVTMDVSYAPEFALLSYDASGEKDAATVVNRITDHAGQMALLQTIENSRSNC